MVSWNASELPQHDNSSSPRTPTRFPVFMGKACRGWRSQELPVPAPSNCSELFVIVGGLRFNPRSHGDDYVVTLFVVKVFDAQLHVVLLDAELRLLSDRQQGGMFVVLGTNS